MRVEIIKWCGFAEGKEGGRAKKDFYLEDEIKNVVSLNS